MFQSREGPIAYHREDEYPDYRSHIAAPGGPLVVLIAWRRRSHTKRRRLIYHRSSYHDRAATVSAARTATEASQSAFSRYSAHERAIGRRGLAEGLDLHENTSRTERGAVTRADRP
jgi:hypothetical protein